MLWTTKCQQIEQSVERNKFIETYDFLKLNQEESENMNWLITPNDIEAVIKKTKVLD